MKTLVNEYLRFCDARVALSTWKAKQTCYRRFLSSQYGDIGDFGPFQAQKYITDQAAERGNIAANADLKNLKTLWNWGRDMGLADSNPWSGLRKLPEQHKPLYVPPVEDVLKVIHAADPEGRTLLTLFVTTGARKSELLKLTWEDIDFERSQIRLSTTKGGGDAVSEWLPLHPDAAALLSAHYDRREKGVPLVFHKDAKPHRELRWFMPHLCKRAGVKPFGFHHLRSFFASLLLDQGKASTKTIQRLLRHKSVRTTEIYLRSMNNDLADVVGSLKITSCG